MHCETCNSMQTFNMINEYHHVGDGTYNFTAFDRVLDLKFLCQSCKTFERRFFVYVNKSGDTLYKVGQYPEWEIKMDKILKKT